MTLEEKTYQVVSSGANDTTLELRSASHWCKECLHFARAMMMKVQYHIMYNGAVELLRNSSASGCHMCKMILERCDPDQVDFYIERTGKADGALCTQVRSPGSFRDRSLVFHRQHHGLEQPNPANLRQLDGTGSTWHDQLARSWLATCQGLHHGCNKRPLSSVKPTRLLELNSFGSNYFVRLRNVQELIQPPSSYCTLSHCWGGKQPLKLTMGTLAMFLDNIPTEILPKTFIDAIQIVLSLGISYLWIDSLCICQDDRIEWLTESVKMGDIYSNGTCNIAALAAGSDYEGCFTEGPTPASSALYFSTKGKRYMIKKPSHYQSRGEQLKSSPLGKRGWVFQELVLSPRTIYYGANRILWDCIGYEADEVQAMQWRLPCGQGAPGYKSAFCQLEITSTTESFRSISRPLNGKIWHETVSEYSTTQLTTQSDRWLALAGLATKYAEGLGRKLVAGLHWDRLLEELGWISRTPAGRLSNGAPTWSWLSCLSEVNMYEVESEKLLAALVAPPDPHMSKCTWHELYDEMEDSSSLSHEPRCYPLTISGHVRSFRYMPVDDINYKYFSVTIGSYELFVEAKRFWLDSPIDNGTTLWGMAHSWRLPFDCSSMILLIVPTSQSHDFWQRVGVCDVRVQGVGRWDNLGDRERFLKKFGPVKDIIIV